MGKINWFYSWKNSDYWWILVTLLLLIIFFMLKAIIESDHLITYIICIILWILAYFAFEYIQKQKTVKPVSLWKIFKSKYPIIVQYTPPKGINPAEAWLLYNLSVEPTDLTSLIYQWKFEKLIDIVVFRWDSSWKNYVKLVKKSEMPLTRPLFESEIFDSIFALNDVKVIEGAFQLRYALMLEDLETHWINKWWVVKISWWKKIDWLYEFLVGLFFASVIALSSWELILFLPYILSFSLLLFFCCVLLWWYIYWWWGLKFTDKWAKLAAHVIWYGKFIKSCDENKIKLLLKEDPLFIDRTLPYATAFWMETEFLKKISPLKKDWNARYYKWRKIPSWIWIFRFFFKNNDTLL